MSATYTDGGVDPISRVRAAIRDIDTTSPNFSDEQLYRWLDAARSSLHVAIYYPSSNTAGVTTATARVVMSGSSLVLQLQRSIDGSPDSITLAPRDDGRVRSAVDDIRALDKDWVVGLGDERRVEWVSDHDGWADSIATRDLANIALIASAGDLALQRQGTLNALGTQDTPARLPFYCYVSALVSALEGVEALIPIARQGYRSKREGNMSWTRGELSPRVEYYRAQTQYGIYAGAC